MMKLSIALACLLTFMVLSLMLDAPFGLVSSVGVAVSAAAAWHHYLIMAPQRARGLLADLKERGQPLEAWLRELRK